ncbi:hypothetical protein SAMN04488112_101201 [Melghirimyces thermohalophilus]|uniref:Uncharacterized protein n=1 Tax=Melghirimyces thermohalophilus TaxID=1236220 RepID=A0A1G6HU37_9BACL|nr:DUF5665 domain-containing protein [Melghirimyces thermohalophilus]SDB96986.1 hypothetical protein SAMN04488112_101201 [Melghirimyces thermohalophilus]
MNEETEETREWLERVDDRLKELGRKMEMGQIAAYVQLLNSPTRLILINILTGVARGVGIAIGFTIFTATIVYVLRKLGALNLPIVGDYIAEIVRIVQAQLELDGMTY